MSYMSYTPYFMNQQPILEVIVCSIEDAVAAERGGANRLEVISHYEVGGLTPSFDLVRDITSTVKIPARVMLRESEPFVVTDKGEIKRLLGAASDFARLPIDGLVLGFLKEAPDAMRPGVVQPGVVQPSVVQPSVVQPSVVQPSVVQPSVVQPSVVQIDHDLVSSVLACAPNLKATFHRAFEELPDPAGAIGELKRHSQIDCILSGSSGEGWAAALGRFVEWDRAARPEIRMLLGGGIDGKAIEVFCKGSSIRAFHVGRAVREQKSIEGTVLAELVRDIATLLGKTSL
jgi:copper homeostasis protein